MCGRQGLPHTAADLHLHPAAAEHDLRAHGRLQTPLRPTIRPLRELPASVLFTIRSQPARLLQTWCDGPPNRGPSSRWSSSQFGTNTATAFGGIHDGYGDDGMTWLIHIGFAAPGASFFRWKRWL
jgi:hypothetical protein